MFYGILKVIMREGGVLMSGIHFENVERKIQLRKYDLPEFAKNFIEFAEIDKKPQTILEYLKDIQLFLEYLIEKQIVMKESIQKLDTTDLSTIKESDIQGFLDYLTKYEKTFTTSGGKKTTQEFTNGPKGKERKRVSVHALFKFLIDNKQIKNNPVKNIQVHVQKYNPKPRLTDKQIFQMFEIALYHNPDEYRAFRNYVILKLFAYTGIRISELINLNLNDVWEERNEVVVIRKNGEEESIYINSNIRDDLYRYVDMRKKIKNIQKGHHEALFLSQRMKRMHPKSVRKMIQIVAKEAGIHIEVTPQTLRRTFGWKHYHKHKDLELTKGILGNETTETVRYNYIEIGNKYSKV